VAPCEAPRGSPASITCTFCHADWNQRSEKPPHSDVEFAALKA